MVFENRVQRGIFGSKREEVVGGWRRLRNEELRRVIKSRRMKWAGQVARMGDLRNAYKIMVLRPEGRKYSEDLGVNGRIILNVS
jgi:hypothetical protein